MSCDYTTDIQVFIGHDNAVTLKPYSDLVAEANYDMTNVTRVTVAADPSSDPGDAILGDSDVQVGGFDVVTWDDSAGEWRIHAKIGLFDAIPAGTYTLRVTVYEPSKPNGLVLPGTDANLTVTVVDAP